MTKFEERPTGFESTAAVLARGGYTLLLTAAGGGGSSDRGLALTRWAADRTRDAGGLFVYLLTLGLGLLASACAPNGSPAQGPDPAPGYRVVAPLSPVEAVRAQIEVDRIESRAGDEWQAHVFRGSDGFEIPFRLLPPENPQHGQRYPLVVVFHGGGHVGTDNQRHLDGLPKGWARPEIRRRYPAYVLAPHMPESSAHFVTDQANGRRTLVPGRPLPATLELIDRLRAELPVDSSRVYALGFSMGAFTIFAALAARPDLFAAAIPIAGVPDPAQAAAVARTPVWIIHGNSDDATPFAPDRAFYPVLAAVPGARVTFWEYDAGGHRVPVDLLSSDAFPRWLWAHRKP